MLRRAGSYPRHLSAAWLLLALCSPGPLLGQVVWSGASGSNDNWSTAANWIGGVAPLPSNSTFLRFDGTSTNLLPNADAPFTLNRLDILGASAYTISGLPLTFAGSGAQINASGASHGITAPILLNTNLLVNNGASLAIDNVGGTGVLTKTGAGTLTLANTPFIGGTVISEGTLQVGTGAALLVPNDFGGPVTNNGALVIDNGSGGFFVVVRELSGSGSLTKNGGGGLISFGPTWTHGGDTTINAGYVGASIASTGRLTMQGGTFETGLSSFGSLAGSGGSIIINGGSLTVGADNSSATFAGTITGSGNLVKNGSGTLILPNTPFTGGTVINEGTLQVGTGAALLVPSDFGGPVTNNGALVIDNGSGGFFVVMRELSGSGSLTKNGGGGLISFGPTWTHGGDTTINAGYVGAPIASTGRLTMQGGTFETGLSSFGSLAGSGGSIIINGGSLTVGADNSSATFAGRITGSGNLVKNGSGTLILPNTPFTGGTVINEGTLQVGTGAALLVPSDFGGPITNNGALVIDNGSGGFFVVMRELSGSGSLTKNGDGGLISFGPTWTHGGDTTINAGYVGASIASTGRLTMQGGTFETGLSGFGSLAGSGGSIIINGGSLTVGADNTSSTYAGTINGSGNLIKSGSGTLILSGASGLAGMTTVAGGRLAVNGSLGSAVTVGAGGTLGGTGRVEQALTVNLAGVVAPGNSIGTLTIGPSAVQSVLDGILEIEIDGLSNDVLSVEGSGGLQFGDSALIRFVLAGAPELDFDYGFLFSSLLTGFDGDVDFEFLGLDPGMRYVVFERDADLYVRFQAQAVPLPSSLLLVLMGFMAMQGTRRARACRHALVRPARPKKGR